MDDVQTQKNREALRQARQILLERARRSETITYKNLTEEITVARYAPNGKPLVRLLGRISEDSERAGRGLLSVLVVRRKDKIPGAGFFALATKLRGPIEDRTAFFQRERDRVFEAEARES